MEKAWSLALWSVLVCRIAIITDNSKGDGTGAVPRQKGRSKWKSRRTIWSWSMTGAALFPHCKYTGRFGDLTAYWQEIVSDAVYLFRLGESEECDWLVLLGQPWSPYSPDGIR